MLKKVIYFSLSLFVFFSCSYNQSPLDKKHGLSLETAKKNQTLNIQYNEVDNAPSVTSKEISPAFNSLIQNKTITNSSSGKLDNNLNSSE